MVVVLLCCALGGLWIGNSNENGQQDFTCAMKDEPFAPNKNTTLENYIDISPYIL